MAPRVIHDFEFVWMLRGRALFVTPREELPLVPGHLLLVPPGVRHSFEWDQHRASRHGYVHFHPDHIASAPLPGDDVGTLLPIPLALALEKIRREWAQMPLRRISVRELTSDARVSPSYLNRLFQAEFGISVAAGLESLRCSRAETLLVRTDMTISSIARHCDFADLYHFSHRFTRRYGVPPSVFRAEGGLSMSALDHPGARRLAHALWE